MKQLFLILILPLFIACNDNTFPSISNDTNQTVIEDNNTSEDNETVIEPSLLGKAQLGVLSKATVKLYELNKEERKLLATELTTSGDSIESIGNFNLNLEKLEDDKFYLYEVEGGEDYDVEDDGVINETPTSNTGLFHLLVKGSHVKTLKTVQVTVLSEIIYQKLNSSLSLEVSEIEIKMQEFAQEIIQEDVNSDGFIGIEDILKFNPIFDKTKLQIDYQNKITKVIDDILNNNSSDFVAPVFKDENSTIKINENLTFVKNIEIEDSSSLSISLLGVDANNFSYNPTTKELSLLTKADFENPHDNDKDNIFELTVQAVDDYFNSTTKVFSIHILDVNETIPQVPSLKDSNLSIPENNGSNAFIGTIIIENEGTSPISSFSLTGDDATLFTVDKEGKLFSVDSFNYEEKNSYTVTVEANNTVGKSNLVTVIIQIEDVPDIKPTVQDVSINVLENSAIGTMIGTISTIENGDSNITSISISGVNSSYFQINPNGEISVHAYLDYETNTNYYLQYRATNIVGDSEDASLTINVDNVFENSGSDYAVTESGIQSALDNADYSFVLTQLLNNRDDYNDLDDDTVNTNIAGAYVGSSGYTVYDITGAMSDGNTSSFNDFVNDITKENDSVATINQLKQADTYYSDIVEGLDCNDTTGLTEVQKDACYNLGLVRLTSLTNSVKLLFGGDATTVQKWANGVDENSSDDLNGNTVLDTSDASACAIVYANDPNDNCKDGTIYSYRGAVQFTNQGKEYNLTLLEIDVGNTTNGYQSFYQLISSNANNNTPILTSGVCDTSFIETSEVADGINYFPCPALDENQDVMGIKQSIEGVANIQDLFPAGDETKTTIESYISNITGSTDGTIGLDNLAEYLRTH